MLYNMGSEYTAVENLRFHAEVSIFNRSILIYGVVDFSVRRHFVP